MMRFILLPILLMFVCIGNALGSTEFIDTLTQISIKLPDNAKIERLNKFKKADITLEKSFLCVYSMKSQSHKQFTWNEVNNFDSKNAYGSMLKYERLGETIDGWIRYYSQKAKNGKDIINCIVLVRGKDFAFYITETAYNEQNLQLPQIVKEISFDNAKKKKALSKERQRMGWIVGAFLFFINIIFFPILKRLSERTYIIIAVISIIAFLLWNLFVLNLGWEAPLIALGSAGCWAITFACDSWGEALRKILNAINKS